MHHELHCSNLQLIKATSRCSWFPAYIYIQLCKGWCQLYPQKQHSALAIMSVIMNLHSSVNIFPREMITVYVSPLLLPRETSHLYLPNKSSFWNESRAPTSTLGEFIKANATLFHWWHLWYHSMSFFYKHPQLHVFIMNILLTMLLPFQSEVAIEVSWYYSFFVQEQSCAFFLGVTGLVYLSTLGTFPTIEHPLTAQAPSSDIIIF